MDLHDVPQNFGRGFVGDQLTEFAAALSRDRIIRVHPIAPEREPWGQHSVLEERNEYIHFGVIVDDLEDCWRRCLAWGAKISKGYVKDRTEAVEDAAPLRSFKVLDPDGNVIDVTANRDEWRGVRVT